MKELVFILLTVPPLLQLPLLQGLFVCAHDSTCKGLHGDDGLLFVSSSIALI
jgi:hypothetical protein